MKQYNKNIFIVAGNNKEVEKETLQEAQEIKEFLEEIYNTNNSNN
jgi:predicted ATPase